VFEAILLPGHCIATQKFPGFQSSKGAAMSRTTSVTTRVLFVIASLCLLGAVACNSGTTGGAPQAASNSATPQSMANSRAIIGAGSTFIYPAMTRWVASFQATHRGVQINYQSIGSGGGI